MCDWIFILFFETNVSYRDISNKGSEFSVIYPIDTKNGKSISKSSLLTKDSMYTSEKKQGKKNMIEIKHKTGY